VTKLFNAIQPDSAFFGQKDVQQCVVIKNMIRDLLFPINLVVVPTIRESDGLAMSSRNRYLSKDERSWASVLYEALSKANEAYNHNGIQESKALLKIATDHIKSNPNVQLEYVSLADPVNLKELEVVKSGAIFSGAVKVGKTRIIDNLLMGITVKDLGCSLK
jgi:pantoate--beta-alanine ligase